MGVPNSARWKQLNTEQRTKLVFNKYNIIKYFRRHMVIISKIYYIRYCEITFILLRIFNESNCSPARARASVPTFYFLQRCFFCYLQKRKSNCMRKEYNILYVVKKCQSIQRLVVQFSSYEEIEEEEAEEDIMELQVRYSRRR